MQVFAILFMLMIQLRPVKVELLSSSLQKLAGLDLNFK